MKLTMENLTNGEHYWNISEKLTIGPWNVEYIALAVYLGIFSLIGIVGNVPVLIVYYNRKDKTASNTFIKVLAILDLIVCLFIMPYTMVYELHLVTSDVFCRMFELLRHFTITSSNITLIAIAAERYIAVCRLTIKLSIQNVQKGMCFIVLVSIVIASPSVLVFAVISKTDVENMNCSFSHEHLTDKFCHFTYNIIGEKWATFYQGVLMIVFFIGFLLIVVFYTIVYIVLWQKTKLRKRMTTRCSREMSLTSEHSQSVCVNENGKQEMWVYSKCHITDPGAQTTTESRVGNDDSEGSLKDLDNNKCIDSSVARASPVQIPLKSKSSKFENRSKRRNHRRTAKMLFLCTVIYLVTWLPFWIDIFGASSNIVFRYLFFVGNACNPIVYGAVNEQVRNSFKKLLSECFGKFRVLFCGKE